MQHELISNKNLKLIKLFKCWREWKIWAKKITHNSLCTNKIMKKRDHEVHWIRTALVFKIQRKMKHSIPFLIRGEANSSHTKPNTIETFSDITRKRLVDLIGQVIHKWSNKLLVNEKCSKIKYKMVHFVWLEDIGHLALILLVHLSGKNEITFCI